MSCITRSFSSAEHPRPCPEGNRLALRLLSERSIDPDKLITHVFELEEIVSAFDVAESKTGIKVVVTL